MCGGTAPLAVRPTTGHQLRPRLAARSTMHVRAIFLPDEVERDVFIVDGRFTFDEQDDAETVVSAGFVLPGLVDAHAHLALASPAGDEASEDERVRASARQHLEAGVLLVREPGSPGRASSGLGPQDGLPRVLTAGRFLAPPGRYFPGLGRETTDDELPDAAEEEARLSGAWVKVIGDFPDSDGFIRANYRADALSEAVRRVHAAGARVAVHTMSAAGVERALEAGVDSIEHGEGMRDDHVAAMARNGTTLVPTMTILPALRHLVREMGLSPQQLTTSDADVARHPEMVAKAADAGVRILAGTDAGLVAHGVVREEIAHLADAGPPRRKALGAGSWDPRQFLGLPAVEEGAPADLVAYRDDPREGLDALANPVVRVLDGRLVTTA